LTTSEKQKYRLLFVPQALAEWKSLDGSVKENLKKLLAKRLNNPHVPGGELHGELSGHYKIKLNKQGVRLVYAVEDDALIVMVMSVDRREDSIVYKSAVARMAQKANTLAKIAKDTSKK
jgi:mRNA interferase RelE/StbE